jgi:hypothetical protein
VGRERASDCDTDTALVVIGGDTLLAMARASAATALMAYRSPRRGWGLARFVGGRWAGRLCWSRSGAFGPADDLVDLTAALLGAASPAQAGTPVNASGGASSLSTLPTSFAGPLSGVFL